METNYKKMLSTLVLLFLVSHPSFEQISPSSTSSSSGQGNHPPSCSSSSNANLVGLYLVLQWPASFCSVSQNPDRAHKCKSKIEEEMLIHGVWGFDEPPGRGITCGGWEQNSDQLKDMSKDLTGKLNQYWKTLFAHQENKNFWEYQWKKHGCCLGLSQEEYFKLAVDTMEAIEEAIEKATGSETSLAGFLKKRGLIPDKNRYYNPAQFPKVIHEELKLITEIRCNQNASGILQIHEIRFCVDAGSKKLVNCVHTNFGKHCQGDIIFPPVEQKRKSISKWIMSAAMGALLVLV